MISHSVQAEIHDSQKSRWPVTSPECLANMDGQTEL